MRARRADEPRKPFLVFVLFLADSPVTCKEGPAPEENALVSSV